MVGAFLLAAAFAAQPVRRDTLPVPAEFELTCLLAGPDGRQDRFAMIASGGESDRRFAFRGEGAPVWATQMSAGSVRGRNNFHFVSNGRAYRLDVLFDRPNGDILTAKADLYEDRGSNSLNMELAGGSCRGAARNAAVALPATPPAPVVTPVGNRAQPTGLRSGHVPSDCVIVMRDLTTTRFGLEVNFDDQGIQFAVSPNEGQPWPGQPFTLRGASLAAQVVPESGPQFMTVYASAGADPASAAPAALNYEMHAQQNQIEGWLQITAHGSSELAGAGFCGVRQSAGQNAGSRQ